MTKSMNIFRFVNKHSLDPCLTGDRLYLAKGKCFHWGHIQRVPVHVAALKKVYGDCFQLTLHFIGKILVKTGVSAEGKSFVWCGERKLESSGVGEGACEIDLSKVQSGILEIILYALEESAVFADNSVKKDTRPRDALYGSLPSAVEKEIQPHRVLYDFLSPSYELCCEELLYYSFSEELEPCSYFHENQKIYFNFPEESSYYCFEEQNVHLKSGSFVNLLTYFNAFSAVKWKKYTNVDRMSIYLDFEGAAKVDAIHLSEGRESKIFASWKLEAEHRTTLELPLGDYPDTGILGIRIYACRESILYGGGYLTDVPEMQAVHLGIGITTYRREKAVKTAVASLGKAIAGHSFYHDSIDITVVDNGQTLAPEDVPAANLIPNRNLGGTGGFMRNLIHYQDEGCCTHCLFMDDDAACETGSLFRSVSFIRHAKYADLAISGAMLSENIQFIQWESGAWFDKCCHPLHCNYDLRDPGILLKNEREDEPEPVYGAWWYFLFPINKVKMFSFPFFVRGDDIEFSYTNKFKIVRMNGIAVWQEDFKIKESPMTLYLDMRSHILHHLVLEHIDHSRWTILKMAWAFFKRFNWAYHYDTANAIAMSFSDMLEGPEYWIKNIDIGRIREKIKKKYAIEVNRPLRRGYKSVPVAEKNIRFPFFTVLFRCLSLNGHLAPSFMIHKRFQRLSKYEVPFINRVFLRNKLLICNERNKTEWVLQRSSRYFFRNIVLMIKTSVKFICAYNKLKKEYREFFKDYLHSCDFWKNSFHA